MSKKVYVTYFRGSKELNELLRELDVYASREGVYVPEKATLTVKDGVRVTKAWKEKCKVALIAAWDHCGFEIVDLQFTKEI